MTEQVFVWAMVSGFLAVLSFLAGLCTGRDAGWEKGWREAEELFNDWQRLEEKKWKEELMRARDRSMDTLTDMLKDDPLKKHLESDLRIMNKPYDPNECYSDNKHEV